MVTTPHRKKILRQYECRTRVYTIDDDYFGAYNKSDASVAATSAGESYEPEITHQMRHKQLGVLHMAQL